MKNAWLKILAGFRQFREKYVLGDNDIMQQLSHRGQQPEIMVVSCCDSRVDPAVILQCDPGDLFVVRNVANIIPPYEKDEAHHGVSAALEFAVCFLKVKHLILLGHSQCGGINTLINHNHTKNDFISNWVSLIKKAKESAQQTDDVAKEALKISYQHALTFPWIKAALDQQQLMIHLWFFDVAQGQIFTFDEKNKQFTVL